MNELIEKDESVFGETVYKAIQKLPQKLIEESEESLRKRVNPSLKMYELRRAFWEELTLAQDEQRKMIVKRVYEGKFSKGHFYDVILKNQDKLAWVLHPLVAYEDRTMAMLDKGLERYEDLLNIDITVKKRRNTGKKDDDGKTIWEDYTDVCPKKAEVLFKVIKDVKDRVKGTAIQRQVNIHASEPKVSKGKAELDMDMVEAKIKELQKQLGEGSVLDGDTSADVCEEVVRDSDIQGEGIIEGTVTGRSCDEPEERESEAPRPEPTDH